MKALNRRFWVSPLGLVDAPFWGIAFIEDELVNPLEKLFLLLVRKGEFLP